MMLGMYLLVMLIVTLLILGYRHHVSAASAAFQSLNHDIRHKGLKGAAITAIKNRYRNSWNKLERTEGRVQILEDQLGIEDRWFPGSKDYDGAFEELTMRKYRLALDKLERLVVQRLLELSKLGMSGLGVSIFPIANCVHTDKRAKGINFERR